MFKRMVALFIVMVWCGDLVAQDSPVIIRVRYITVKEGMRDEFIDAAAKKTRRFNSKEGSPRFFTWEITDGPRQGQFVRGQSGTTWSDFDSPPDQKGRDYWMKNVNPYIKEQGNMQTWRYFPDISYDGRGDNVPPNFARQRFYNINPGMDSRMIEIARKIKQVSETNKADVSYAWYHLESGGDRSTWLSGTRVYKWEDLANTGFVAMYEEVHGKGSCCNSDSWLNHFRVFNCN